MKRSFTKLIGCMALALAATFNSCQKNADFASVVAGGDKPVAAFTNNSGSLSVTFTNTSTNLESSYWQFGDATTSTDKSPVHAFAAAGSYTVTLKTNSPAGYSATTTKTITVAGPAISVYSITPVFGLNVSFNGNGSSNVASLAWDFGDGGTSTSAVVDHRFPTYGTYSVKLTVTGLLGDVSVQTQSVVVADNNLLKGGDMEASASAFWTQWSSQNNNPPVYGYTGAKPTSGYDACLRFPSFSNSAALNELIYQAVQVTAGKQYKLSAQVKAPAGGKNDYLQFYISTDANNWKEAVGDPTANYFLCLNNYHAWGTTSSSTTAIDGDLYAATQLNGIYGLGAVTGGIYTATATGTVYIGIQCGLYGGQSNGDILVDNVKFVQIN